MNMKKKTCFVMIGYGERTYLKKDKKKGVVDLNKTYEEIIAKVFDELNAEGYNFDYFRGIDLNQKRAGIIHFDMFSDIYHADFVIADISTQNANVMYELGVRHALKPKTTLLICESETDVPFDINQIVIEKYEHQGKGILSHHQREFVATLKEKIKHLVNDSIDSKDSPVYHYLPGLTAPQISTLIIEHPHEFSNESLGEIIRKAEIAKNKNDFSTAIDLIKKALLIDEDDHFLLQRLALLTYKSELPSIKESLLEASIILCERLKNDSSFDKETLGLSGAVYKRLHELTSSDHDLDNALRFYGKGYYILGDYYNGINLAYLFTLRAATIQTEKIDAQVDYVTGNRIRVEVKRICEEIIQSEEFAKREDKNWIYLTLAEIEVAFGNQEKESELIQTVTNHSEGNFDFTSYYEQRSKLQKTLTTYSNKFN
jgi:tetratricopeptide (TPR) repeat protein